MPRAPSKPDLHLVAPVPSPGPVPGDEGTVRNVALPELSALHDLMDASESRSERVRRLQAEARSLALEEVWALDRLLVRAAAVAGAIADGGEAYPVGVREMTSRLALDLQGKADTLRMILSRHG